MDPYQGLDPVERTERARMGAHASWKTETDRTGRTAPARKALRDRFAREVDPDGVLSDAELAERVHHAQQEHMSRMRMARATAQRRKREAAAKAEIAARREAAAKRRETQDVA